MTSQPVPEPLELPTGLCDVCRHPKDDHDRWLGCMACNKASPKGRCGR